MKKEHSYNVLKVLQIIRALLLIILSITILCSAIVGHCASDQDYFPMTQNQNGNITQNVIDFINNDTNIDTVNNYVVSGKIVVSGNYTSIYVATVPKATNIFYAEKHNDLKTFSYYLGISGSSSGLNVWEIKYRTSNPTNVFKNNATSGGLTYFVNCTSSNYSTSVSYISNFQVYTNNNSETRKIVLLYDDGITIPEDDTAREDMEKPKIDDYIPDWTNTPNFDNSSVENALESVYNCIVWLGSNIKDTITGTGEYIADTIRWAIQKILNTIRDVFSAITNKLNEVKNTILTVADKIQSIFDYISQPLQTPQVVAAIQNTDIHTDIVSVINLSNTAFGIFGTVAEPQNFTILLDLTGISILHQTQPFYIDLSWIIDARQYIRAFMWCIVTFGLLYSIVIGIPSMLKDGK